MAEPRDHILSLATQLRSDMTTLANVTCKVRVNGGSATTYTNVSSPAITQYTDCTFGYELKIAASTYADGDVIEVTWLYSATAYAVDNIVIGPASVDGAYYTTARGTKLDNLDAAISGIATAVWAAGTRTLTSLGSLAADVWAVLTSGLTTVGSIGKLLVTNIDTTISSRASTLQAATVTLASPVLQSGQIVLVQGDDYKAADGRQLTFTSTSWPTLTGGTVALKLRNSPTATATSYAGSVVSASSLKIELTAAQTVLLSGPYKYDVVATLSNGDVVTLANGNCLVSALP